MHDLPPTSLDEPTRVQVPGREACASLAGGVSGGVGDVESSSGGCGNLREEGEIDFGLRNQAEDYARIARAIDFLRREARRQPTLAEVAASVHLSEFHFQRLFARWAGVSPKRLLQLLTLGEAKRQLAASADVLSASLDAGLSSPGRLHDLFVSIDAVTPGEFKAGGVGLAVRYGFHPTPFGECLIATTPRGVCFLEFLTEEARPEMLLRLAQAWPGADTQEDTEATALLVARIFSRAVDSVLPDSGEMANATRGGQRSGNLPANFSEHPSANPAANSLEPVAKNMAGHVVEHPSAHRSDHLLEHPSGYAAGHAAGHLPAQPIKHLPAHWLTHPPALNVLVKGTNFQAKVWQALLKIPRGQVATYAQVAEWAGHPAAARAVGSAIGANPVAWLIPCHRVLRGNGELGGYHWGETRKVACLAWEGAGVDFR